MIVWQWWQVLLLATGLLEAGLLAGIPLGYYSAVAMFRARHFTKQPEGDGRHADHD